MGNAQTLKNADISQSQCVIQYFDLKLAFHHTFNEPLQLIGIRDNDFLVFQIVFIHGRYSAIDLINSTSTLGESILDEQIVFQSLIEQNLDFIIRSWIDYFLYNKIPSFEVIEKRLSIN